MKLNFQCENCEVNVLVSDATMPPITTSVRCECGHDYLINEIEQDDKSGNWYGEIYQLVPIGEICLT